ncbi:hypothetical protein FDECE_16738 [Fusarium decemcellulare]|nr:hypothetical protein FDECE_16738 [Fusarium decemcellulare]
MSTAHGVLIRTSPNRLNATFVVDGIQYTYAAAVNPAIQPFSSNSAKLVYENVDDLTSTRQFSGRIGPNNFKLTLNNGAVIEGELSPPGIQPASTIDGTGVWEAN